MNKNNNKKTFPTHIGTYKLLDLIGRGGIGEVFLAEDTICQRIVALKRLSDPESSPYRYTRFLSEPKIAAKLAHPSIIPIYSLHESPPDIFYTMPYIEGETLFQILAKTRYAQERAFPPHVVGNSVYALMLIFLNICHAIHYAHSSGFLHRDIKPSNIMVRNLTQVVILDWGVATSINKMEEYEKYMIEHNTFPKTRLTYPRQPMGTFDYMAPERVFEKPSNIQGDIYSLGATLYHMLTLRKPFKRPDDIEDWKQQLLDKGFDSIPNPQSISPERGITPQLVRIIVKCLEIPSRRYTSVQEIIEDVTNYIQGKPEWTLSHTFYIKHVSDWEFQENILFTKHMAISRYAGTMEWTMVMLSKERYSGNIQLTTQVQLQQGGKGIGFLLCVPEKCERHNFENSYIIWIGSKKSPGCMLLRSNVEVINKDSMYLEENVLYTIKIQRQNNTFSLYVNDVLVITYTSHFLVIGGHFGLLFHDTKIDIAPISLFIGSQNVQVNCLSIPNTFFMIKDYSMALAEYRRIARSFKGRAEGREATFRAGITLIAIEKGKKKGFDQALQEFEKLHKSAGAPLEYLGKSLVYQEEKNLEEEIKYLELAIRMYPKHPLIHIIKEHITFRLYETAQKDRKGAYTFALLTIRHLPTIYEKKEAQNFIHNLTSNWEAIPFIEHPTYFATKNLERIHLSIQLAFWLAHPIKFYELIHVIPKGDKNFCLFLENILLSIILLECPKLALFILNVKLQNIEDPKFLILKDRIMLLTNDLPIADKLHLLKAPEKFFLVFIKQHLTITNVSTLLPYFEKKKLPQSLHIWALLLAKKTQQAQQLLKEKPINDPTSLFYLLQGCFLARTKGEKAALHHFKGIIETHFPTTPSLLAHFLQGNITLKSSWMQESFLWERVELYRQLALYHYCLDHVHKAKSYEKMLKKEFLQSQIPLNFF